jgi:hypothetical protein
MPSLGPLGRVVEKARSWPVDSQQVARRNAMIACTALAARRAEREDVEEYLARVAGARPTASGRLVVHG